MVLVTLKPTTVEQLVTSSGSVFHRTCSAFIDRVNNEWYSYQIFEGLGSATERMASLFNDVFANMLCWNYLPSLWTGVSQQQYILYRSVSWLGLNWPIILFFSTYYSILQYYSQTFCLLFSLKEVVFFFLSPIILNSGWLSIHFFLN